MGGPMTYHRLIMRNQLQGGYGHDGHEKNEKNPLLAGDLRRLEKDTLDDLYVAAYAQAAGISRPKVRRLFELFFTTDGVPRAS